jgi:hypothetical protein
VEEGTATEADLLRFNSRFCAVADCSTLTPDADGASSVSCACGGGPARLGTKLCWSCLEGDIETHMEGILEMLPTLTECIGREPARQALVLCKRIIRTPAARLRATWATLVAQLGDAGALKAVGSCPSVLCATCVVPTWDTLVAKLGGAGALKAVGSCPTVLTAIDPAGTWDALVAKLGDAGALKAVRASPSVLRGGDPEEVMHTLRQWLGRLGADAAIARSPSVLKARHATAVAYVLAKLLGDDTARIAIGGAPTVLMCTVPYVNARVEYLCSRLTHDGAMRALEEAPSTLLQTGGAIEEFIQRQLVKPPGKPARAVRVRVFPPSWCCMRFRMRLTMTRVRYDTGGEDSREEAH